MRPDWDVIIADALMVVAFLMFIFVVVATLADIYGHGRLN